MGERQTMPTPLKAAEDEFMAQLSHIQTRFCDRSLGSRIKLKIAGFFESRKDVSRADFETLKNVRDEVTERITRNPEVNLVAYLGADDDKSNRQSGIGMISSVCKKDLRYSNTNFQNHSAKVSISETQNRTTFPKVSK